MEPNIVAALGKDSVDRRRGTHIRTACKKSQVSHLAREALCLLDERVTNLDAQHIEVWTSSGEIGAEVPLAAANVEVQWLC